MNNANHPAAHFCRSLSIGGYDDWYLPATQEWDILYRAFKPQVTGSGSYFGESYGANPYAVPQAGNYNETNPARTALSAFQEDGAESLRYKDENVSDDPFYAWTSTQASSSNAVIRMPYLGTAYDENKTYNFGNQVRAIRRIQVLP